MGFFPILDDKPFSDLMALFRSNPREHGIDSSEGELFFQEVAVGIAKSGTDGVAFLLDSLKDADPERMQAILLGFGFVEKESVKEVESALMPFLLSPNPDWIAKSVDALGQLGCSNAKNDIVPLLKHDSPYVVGSALRFFARHHASDAKGMLLKALTSSEPIIRQNAIDELDELECTEAVPSIAVLLNDTDENVREAAQWAVTHLEEAMGKPKPHRAKAG